MTEQNAGDDRGDLPDGTDTVIEGAAKTGDDGSVTVEDTDNQYIGVRLTKCFNFATSGPKPEC